MKRQDLEAIERGASFGLSLIKAAGEPGPLLLNQNEKHSFNFAAFFGGPGIGSTGVIAAGGNECFNLDIGDIQEVGHKLNSKKPYVKMSALDATPKSVSDYLQATGHPDIPQGFLDFLLLSPCCQDISIANPHKTLFSFRNKLLLDCARLIGGDDGFKPKVAIIENVFNLANFQMLPLMNVFLNLCDGLKDYYYEYGVFNALDYQVGQPRRRILIQFVRKDVGRPVWPSTTTTDYSSLNLNAILPYVVAFRVGKEKKFKSADRPVNTITTNGRIWVKLTDGTERLLTVEEGKLLSTVPAWFSFEGLSRQEAFLLLGNAIMPRFIQPFVEVIRDNLLM